MPLPPEQYLARAEDLEAAAARVGEAAIKHEFGISCAVPRYGETPRSNPQPNLAARPHCRTYGGTVPSYKLQRLGRFAGFE